LDLSKAFDSVSHFELLEILKSLGVKGRAFSWFSSYLDNRKQYVNINYLNKLHQKTNISSSLKNVNYGVPQGSILGPLLFICYLKGLPDLIGSGEICLYADDINLKFSSKSWEELEVSAFRQLSLVDQNLSNLNLLINSSKTKFITFNTSQRKCLHQPNIFIGEEQLQEETETKFLGFKLDKHLNWTLHIDDLCKKISSGIYALRRMSKLCSQETLKSIYFALVHSHISFGIVLYGATSFENLNKILILQKETILCGH